MHDVLNDYNCFVKVSDEDIRKAIEENTITYAIMQAMGQSHREEYMKYIIPFLEHEYFYVRRKAIQSILNVNGKLGLDALKKKSEQYSMDDEDPWNKILLMVAVMLVEGGAEKLKRYFISEGGDAKVKNSILTFYSRGYQFEPADIELICFYLRAYINQSFEWIKEMKKRDRTESIDFAFNGLTCAGEGTCILSDISNSLSEEICSLCEEVVEKKIGSDSMHYIAIISQYMRKEYGIRILKVLKDRVKGSAKSEFKKSLKKWNVDAEEL